MQVNISFNGAIPAAGADNTASATQAFAIEDAGSAPALDGVATASFDDASGLPAQVGAQVDIGAPPGWLHEAIAAHKASTASESAATETASAGEDGGAGPGE